MKSKISFNRMLAQYLRKTKLPVSLFWMSSAFLLPQMATAQETSESLIVAEESSEMVFDQEMQISSDGGENTVKSVPILGAKMDMSNGKMECCTPPPGCCNPVLRARWTCCPPEKKDECGRPIPHQKNCCCNNCSNATPPLENLGFSVDILYFKPIEDTLRYAEKNTFSMGQVDPRDATYQFPIYSSPPGQSLNQNFDYKLGVRANLQIPTTYDEWEVDVAYTYFHTKQPPAVAVDPNQFLFTTVSNSFYPLANNALNNQCGYVKGVWRLKMDVIDLEFKRPFLIGQSLMIEPLIGIKSAFIRQLVHVYYRNYYLIYSSSPGYPPVESPQKVIAKSKVWGVGPELGTELKFLIPHRFSLFLRGAVSCMLGQFNTTTKYTDLVTVYGGEQGATIIQEKITRLFSVTQLQGAISKWWMIGRCASLEAVVGWETQVWWRQNRMNWYSTVALPPDGSDLTLQGPFGRVSLTF